jgi:type II secretory pathway component PulF
MPKFVYTGTDDNGANVRRTVTADDRFAVYDIAREAGHEVAEIKAHTGWLPVSWFDLETINYHLNRVSQDELVMVTRNLSSMLVAGLTFSRALSVIERQSSNPRLQGITKRLIGQINQGDQIHVAMQAFPNTFDDLFIAMVRAGEESGKLADALQTLSRQMQQSANLKKRIRGAMMYPSIVLTVMVGIGFLMMIFVMPTITSVFDGMDMELPATTQALIAVSDFINTYTFVTLLGLISGVVAMVMFFRSRVGKRIASWVIVRLPVIGTMAKETNAARTARTLASLLQSGVDVLRALEITKDVVQNVYYKEVLQIARDQVEQGNPMSETFIEHSKLYPVLVGEMILVGEETGQIADMLGELAVFYENEVERKTKDLSTIIEPLLMVVIGAGVGFFALALIGPIYSISDGII